MAAKREVLKNNASTTLAEALGNGVTSVDVTDGAVFPATGEFRLLIGSEIILCTARATDTLTLVRGQEGTTDADHDDGSTVTHVLTQGSMQRYGRDNDYAFDGTRPPFRLVDANNVLLDTGDFTKVDGTNATTPVDQDGSISVIKTSASANPDYTILARAAPGGSYTVVSAMKLLSVLTGTGSKPAVGLAVRDSNTGKMVTVEWRSSGGANAPYQMAVRKMNSLTALSAAYYGPLDICYTGEYLWCKVHDDTTNLVFSISMDGINWQQVASKARTDFMAAPDQVCWFINNENNVTYNALGVLCAWDEGA